MSKRLHQGPGRHGGVIRKRTIAWDIGLCREPVAAPLRHAQGKPWGARLGFFGARWLWAVLALALLPGGAREGFAQRPVKAGAIRIVLPPGQVARQTGQQIARLDAKKDMPVYYKDVLETGVGGRLRARLDDGSILALGSQSRLTVVEHNQQTQQSTIQLEYGKVRAQVIKLTRPGSKFEVRSNTAVAGVLGTDEIIDAFSPIATSVICVDGLVSVSNSDPAVAGTVTLNPGEITVVQQGLPPTAPRAATSDEIDQALEGSSGAAPQAVADIGTGFVTAGTDLALSAEDSFATGAISGYQWIITRAADNTVVYNQSQSSPRLTLDTTPWQPGNYAGTLTITTSNNLTASVTFGFVVLPAVMANTSPDQIIQQMRLAYETLQPSEFMKLFDPLKYSGYAALQQSVETSFRSIAQARVFVRKASGQIFPEQKVAVYQVDFEIQFSTKAQPTKLFVVREQATLRMESGSGWLIADVPQGSLGSAGLPGIPGVGDPSQANSTSGEVTTDARIILTGGGGVVLVPSGGSSNAFTIQNTSSSDVTITFSLPPGITLTGPGVSGNTVIIPAGQSVTLVFSAAPGQPTGTVPVSSTVTTGDSSLPGPTIPVTVFQLSLSFPAAGSSAANPVPVLLGLSGTAVVQVSTSVPTGASVSLAASGGQVAAAFSPNPVAIPANAAAATSTVTLTPVGGAAPGADQVTVQASAGSASVSAPLFINRIAPFTLSGGGSLDLQPNQSGSVSIAVTFNPPFSGPVQVSAPAAFGGVSFSPASLTLNGSGAAVFTAAAGNAALNATSFTFTATAGGFSATRSVTIRVGEPIEFSLSGASISLAQGQSGQASVQVSFVSGTPQPVQVAVVPESVDGNRITVTGGGTVPNASGSVAFTVTVKPNTPPGATSFTVTANAGATVHQTQVSVTILGDFQLTGPTSINLLQGGSASATIGLTPLQGFDSVVALTASSNHPEITVNGPSTLSAGQQVVFTIAASNSAAGPAAVTIQGVSGNVTRSLTIAVLVSSFALSTTAPQPIPLFIGGTASLPVTVTAVAGFTGDVQLAGTATGGVTVDSVSPVTGGSGARTFTLGTVPGATPGAATITITGTSGALTSSLQVSVQVTEGFSLSAAPTTFFLGNANSLTIQIVRAAGFGGSVTLQVGPLPPGITSVQPTSVIAAADTNSAVFQVTAAADPALSGQTVSIAITGSVTGVPPQGFGRAAGEPSAHLTSINATGTLQAPFSVSTGGTSLGTIQVNQPATATVAVAFLGSPAFPGPVSVTASAPAGLTLSGGGSSLSASGSVSFTFTGATPGSYSPQVVAQAGSFIVTTIFSVEVTAPSNPFLLSVLPSTQPLQVNANVPVALQAQILPQLQTFTQTVTVTVTDGSQMKFNPICGNPAGFVSYTAGILTFNVGPPYSSVSFCMSAGQAVNASINSGGDSATVTAAASNSPNIILTYNFQIGVPELVVARATTFTIPAAGSVVANITLNAVSGFNLPVHVHLTGQGSSIGSSGPVEAPLPAGVSSADCGPHPSSQGKDVSPGQTITCTITNTSTSGSTSPITVEVFGVFPVTNPGASVVAFFQVCTLGPSITACNPAVQREDIHLSRGEGRSSGEDTPLASPDLPDLTIAPSDVQFSPLLPNEGDRVTIRARVENRGAGDARDASVALLVNKEVVATQTVAVRAGSAEPLEFEWQAAYSPRLSVAVAVAPDGGRSWAGSSTQIAVLRNLAVERAAAAAWRQGRSLVVVRNGDCSGFRFLTGSQSFCGGNSDFEVSPAITSEGQLLVEILSLTGGIIDLGPQPLAGGLTAPESGYQNRALLQGGHVYAVQSNGKYALLYAAGIQSDVDPRLARLLANPGSEPAFEGLESLAGDRLERLLDQSRVTVDVQWSYLDNGSRVFRYGFAAGSSGTRPGLYRQPRSPANAAQE